MRRFFWVQAPSRQYAAIRARPLVQKNAAFDVREDKFRRAALSHLVKDKPSRGAKAQHHARNCGDGVHLAKKGDPHHPAVFAIFGASEENHRQASDEQDRSDDMCHQQSPYQPAICSILATLFGLESEILFHGGAIQCALSSLFSLRQRSVSR